MKLLIASDGSASALHAVRFGADLLGKFAEPGSITLISVHDDTALHHARRFVGQQAIDEYLHGLSEQDVSEARSLLDAAGIRHETVMRTGHVAAEIAAAADQGSFDMIVLGSKGRTGFRDMLVGSVAKRVAELATVPVVLVR